MPKLKRSAREKRLARIVSKKIELATERAIRRWQKTGEWPENLVYDSGPTYARELVLDTCSQKFKNRRRRTRWD